LHRAGICADPRVAFPRCRAFFQMVSVPVALQCHVHNSPHRRFYRSSRRSQDIRAHKMEQNKSYCLKNPAGPFLYIHGRPDVPHVAYKHTL